MLAKTKKIKRLKTNHQQTLIIYCVSIIFTLLYIRIPSSYECMYGTYVHIIMKRASKCDIKSHCITHNIMSPVATYVVHCYVPLTRTKNTIIWVGWDWYDACCTYAILCLFCSKACNLYVHDPLGRPRGPISESSIQAPAPNQTGQFFNHTPNQLQYNLQ